MPTIDRYTVAGDGHPYHDIHWLFQVLLALAYAAGGFVGVSLLTIAMWTATLTLCYRAARSRASPLACAALLFAGGMACIERFVPRPEMVTFLCLAGFLLILLEGGYRRPLACAILIGLQVVWTNAHGLFVLGPFLVGCVAIQALLRRREEPGQFVRLLGLLGALLAATLVNPRHVGSWSYAWLLLTQVGPKAPSVLKALGELSPTFGAASRGGLAFPFFASLLVVVAIGSIHAIARRRLGRADVAGLLALLGLLAASLTGRRNMVLFALVAIPMGARLFPWPTWSRPGRFAFAAVGVVGMVATAAHALTGRYYLTMGIPARSGLGFTPSYYPHGLAPFLDRIDFRGNVLNSNALGGFYMFHNYPRRRPLTEGRWTAYDDQVVARLLAAPFGAVDFRWAVDAYRIEGLVLGHGTDEAQSLLPVIARDPAWRLVYYDQAASFWIAAAHPKAPPPLDLEAPLAFPMSDRVDDCIRLEVFFSLTGAVVSRIENLERATRFEWFRPIHLKRLGRLQVTLGRNGDAEGTYRRFLEERPEDVDALNTAAWLASLRGDTRRAEALLDLALRIRPGDAELLGNRRRLQGATPAP
ncbi:MAG: tetratricopeptide repeat protein [Myxococcales bacterium]|nr:tetratricopeptide repeat protein [Myxococcales bacterium]